MRLSVDRQDLLPAIDCILKLILEVLQVRLLEKLLLMLLLLLLLFYLTGDVGRHRIPVVTVERLLM